MNFWGKSGFLIFSLIILFTLESCEKEVFTGAPDSVTSKYSQVYVRSNPSGALIYLNSKNMGKRTPDSLNWLPEGKQSVTLKLPLYQDTTFTFYLNGETKKNLFVDLSLNPKNFGSLYVSSTPAGSDIWLNNVLLNKKTPWVINQLVPGDYKVKLSYAFHRPDSTIVTVNGSSLTNLSLALEDTSKWVSYTSHNSPIVSDIIISAACDKKNAIWVGTNTGLISISGSKWNLFTTQNSLLQSDYITCIGVDNSDLKWIGTSSGLFTFDGNVWQNLSDRLPDPHVTSILFDKTGNAWIGTYAGLVKYSNNSWSVYDITDSGLKENLITCLIEDNSGRIWVGTPHNYINIFDGKNWVYYDNTNINPRIRGTGKDAYLIQSMALDNKGTIWAILQSSGGGCYVMTFDGSLWNFFDEKEFLMGNYPLYMYVKNNKIIFGKNTGISIWDTNTNSFNNFNYANSALKLFRIQSVVIDNQNNIWAGSFYYGLGKFKYGIFKMVFLSIGHFFNKKETLRRTSLYFVVL